MLRFACSLVVLLALGCASGRDRSPSYVDTGPRVDTGAMMEVDSGPPSDTGPRPPDSGPPGTDSGPRVDTGPTCSEFMIVCGGECVDPDVDERHCSGCGRSCSVSRDCVDGTCVDMCPMGLARCGADCVDVTSDPANCGSCGRACLPGESCNTGVCSPCPPGLTMCGAGCVDVMTDRSNCGMCGRSCPAGETCRAGACARGLSGMTGMTWEPVPGAMGGMHGFESWVPAGDPHLYLAAEGNFARLEWMTNTWTPLASPPVTFPYWGTPARANGYVWGIRENRVLRYDIMTNSWTMVRADLHGGAMDDLAMTISDRDGYVWSYNALDELVRYDPRTDTVAYYPSGVAESSYETRLVYDQLTHSIYFAGFAVGTLNRFDIATSRITPMAPNPEGFLNDPACGDRNGHIYVAGGGSGTSIWQLDVVMNTWREIPPYPIDHGVNGSCAVLEDGWLYLEPISATTTYRLRLL